MNYTELQVMPKMLITLMLLAVMLLSCNKDRDSVLKGCCGNEAIDVSFGNGHLYMPNIFTPNGDGINDGLYLQGDSIKQLIMIEITSQSGDSIVQFTELPAGNFLTIWDGTIDGVVRKGLYSIFVTAEAEDGTTISLQGKVCNYPCDNIEIDETISPSGCQFGDQVGQHFSFDPMIPTSENLQDCFN
jgi:hypothetical protein